MRNNHSRSSAVSDDQSNRTSTKFEEVGNREICKNIRNTDKHFFLVAHVAVVVLGRIRLILGLGQNFHAFFSPYNELLLLKIRPPLRALSLDRLRGRSEVAPCGSLAKRNTERKNSVNAGLA